MIRKEDEEFLEHFGKKGMKWGVRKTPNRSQKKRSTSSGSKKLDAVDTASKVATGALFAASLFIAGAGYKLSQ